MPSFPNSKPFFSPALRSPLSLFPSSSFSHALPLCDSPSGRPLSPHQKQAKGNSAFIAKDYPAAVAAFTEAIAASGGEPSHVLFSNRSAALVSLNFSAPPPPPFSCVLQERARRAARARAVWKRKKEKEGPRVAFLRCLGFLPQRAFSPLPLPLFFSHPFFSILLFNLGDRPNPKPFF